MLWNEKPYYSLDFYLKNTFGEKIYKLALDGGMTCPNRDGSLGSRGCIFCSSGGSGDFAVPAAVSVKEQIERARLRVSRKINNGSYIAYFQSYTNTYAPVPYLDKLFTSAIEHPDISILSIATRPDCIPDEVINLLIRLSKQKPVWVELGLQTIHEETADFIRRGYKLSCFEDTLQRLKQAGIPVIVHVILGLPGEDRQMMLDTAHYLGRIGINGIKLQLLHVLKGTDLEAYYNDTHFPLPTLYEYADLIVDIISILPPDIVIHRISGDGPKHLLTAPLWSADKRLVLNTISKRFKERNAFQGCQFDISDTVPSADTCTP